MKKIDLARDIFQKMAGSKRADVVRAIAEKLDTSSANASTYYSRIEKQGTDRSLDSVASSNSSHAATEVDYVDMAEKDRIAKRDLIRDKFDTLDRQAKGIRKGTVTALVVSGAAGGGKTYSLEAELDDLVDNSRAEIPCKFISGGITAVGLYMALHQMRKGGVLVLDDCDDVFFDQPSLNILKKALDTTGKRRITWQKRSDWVYIRDFNLDLDGEPDENDRLPNWFDFNGQVVFITNEDLISLSRKSSKMAPHYRALISRALYLDTSLHTTADKLIRIEDIFLNKMAPNMGLSKKDARNIFDFTVENRHNYIDLSLRLMVHQTNLFKTEPTLWQKDAKNMLMVGVL